MTEIDIQEAAQYGKDVFLEGTEDHSENPYNLFDRRVADLFRYGSKYDAVVITDYSDSDGAGCAVLYTHKFDNVLVLPASHGFGKNPLEAFKTVSRAIPPEIPLYITDLGPNEGDATEWITTAFEFVHTNPLYIRDHHETPSQVREAINDMSNGEYVHDSGKSATKIVYETDYPDAPEYLKEFVEVTNARDLFLTDDPRFEVSSILASAVFWFKFDDYIQAALKYGVHMEKDETIGAELEKRAELREKKLEWALNHAEDYEICGKQVSIVYGDCYHSEAGRRLIESEGKDIVVIIKPSGKTSFRTEENTPIAVDLAREFGGGGHPNAAGCNPPKLDSFEFNKNSHQETMGRGLKQEVLKVIEEKVCA